MKEKEKKRSYGVASGTVCREEEAMGLHQGRCVERRKLPGCIRVGKPAGSSLCFLIFFIRLELIRKFLIFFMVNKKSTSSSSVQLVLPSPLGVDYARI